ncbi:EAL domain-containing protein [Woodsholea maritima]|uniref:EAL domain-containing protein n=1 Tax=Woodsholea maritima TaxID=240237 RepID=UPI00036C65E0|nr:EAL domain-containing protein [Woodsholea maritima]
MPRATDILVVITYALVAVVAALAFERFGLMSTGLAWLMGAMVFLLAGQVHSAAARVEERAKYENELHEMRAANMSLLDELEGLSGRVEQLQSEVHDTHEIAQRTEAVLQDQIERHWVDEKAPTVPQANLAEENVIAELIAKLEKAGTHSGELSPNIKRGGVDADVVQEALDENRVDLYLQPIVTLPQRRTYFYEGFTRLRDHEGKIIPPGAFLSAAEEAGLITEVDNLLLFRCVQIVRRLTKSDRRIGIFCNISPRSLQDETFFPDFLEFLRRQSDLAGSLIFEMPQSAFLNRSAIAARNMSRLADFGFRFSIDQVTNLNVDLAELQRASVRFMKVGGERLIEATRKAEPIAGREPGAIAPEDIAGLFARYSVDLIAEKIETEGTVVEILDLDVAYGQGHLFGEPRPVREDVMAETGVPARMVS